MPRLHLIHVATCIHLYPATCIWCKRDFTVACSGGSSAAWQAISTGRGRVSEGRGRRSSAKGHAPSQRDWPVCLDRQRRLGQGGASGARRQRSGRRRSTHHRASDHSAARVRQLLPATAPGDKRPQPVVHGVLGTYSWMHLRRWHKRQQAAS